MDDGLFVRHVKTHKSDVKEEDYKVIDFRALAFNRSVYMIHSEGGDYQMAMAAGAGETMKAV